MSNYFRPVRTLYSRLRGPQNPDPVAPPLRITDAEQREIRLRAYDDAALESLVTMYDTFDPAQRAQGTPPLGESGIRNWLDCILGGNDGDSNENCDAVSVVAWHDDRVVGHVAFVPDGVGRHELAIFVHQDYQRAGIGSKLLRSGLEYANQRGVTKVWLTVESWKGGVQKLYSDAGFTLDNPLGPTHRMSRYL